MLKSTKKLSPLMHAVYMGCVIGWFFIVLVATAQPAYAYVDPGSGLLLLQIVGSTFAGMTFLLRKNIRRLFERFSKHPRKEEIDIAHR
jgi:hypothetical protein